MKRKFWLYGAGLIVLFLVGFGVSRFEPRRDSPQLVRRSQIALGTVVEIQVRGMAVDQADRAVTAAFQEIHRVETLLQDAASFKAGPIWAGPEVDWLLGQCNHFWHLSAGAFDCAIGPLVDAWGFNTPSPALPAPGDLVLALEQSGWQDLRAMPGGTWEAARPVSLAFGAIGKGYAVDRALAVLQEHGVGEALVNAGGDLSALGGSWSAGIQHPRHPGQLVAQFELVDQAAATSGDYEQFFIQDGRRYHHILDPRTGDPPGELQSVTVLAPSCTEADALATLVFVLGVDGLALVERLPGIEAYLVTANGEAVVSSGFQLTLRGDQ